MRRATVSAVIFLVPLVISVAVTLLEGTPKKLPWIALGSDVLLHVERAVLLLWLFVLTLVALVRTGRGELPVELSTTGVRYEVRKSVDDTAKGMAGLEAKLMDQEEVQQELVYRIQYLERRAWGKI